MIYRVGVIGTGVPEGAEGYAMAYRHASGYERLSGCDLVTCADVVAENAAAFAREFGIERDAVYEDHEALLAEARPEIVSVCTPTTTHADIVIDCARSGVVEAVHCEKPMAETWADCRDMVAACDRHGVQLTFNHQRRFAAPYRTAKSMLDDGHIGTLERIELGGPDLYDYGTHLFDMCGYLTEQTPIEWVLAQVDRRDPETAYGLYRESEALARWRYESGVDGFASTGDHGLLGCEIRLVGDEGVIEIGRDHGPALRIRTDGGPYTSVDVGRDGAWRLQTHPLDRALERVPLGPDRLFSPPTYVERAVRDAVRSLRDGTTPELAAENALQSTEVIFACWESARRGGRVELPLDIADNPLDAMVDAREPSRSA